MIKVTRINGAELLLNAELIQTIESTPDTLITLIDGRKLMVNENVDEVVRRIITYRRKVNLPELTDPLI